MSQRPNGSRRGPYSCISALAIAAALFAIAALTSLPSKAAMSGTRASTAQTASTTQLAVEGNMPPLDGANRMDQFTALEDRRAAWESSPD
jgi:hypothetical protein